MRLVLIVNREGERERRRLNFSCEERVERQSLIVIPTVETGSTAMPSSVGAELSLLELSNSLSRASLLLVLGLESN